MLEILTPAAPVSLSVEEERALIAASQAGDGAATETLIGAYSPAIRGAVQWYRRALPSVPQRSDAEDVEQEALVGLLEAIRAFDPEKHDRLAAIAAQYVRQRVAEAARSASAFAVPERTLKRFFSILRECNGDTSAALELAPSRKMARETFLAVLASVRGVGSYDAPAPDGTTREESDRSVDGEALAWAQPELVGERDEDLVRAAFAAVDDVEERVCRVSYGFEDYEPQPDGEVAHRLGLSRPKVQRVRTKALAKMREALGAE